MKTAVHKIDLDYFSVGFSAFLWLLPLVALPFSPFITFYLSLLVLCSIRLFEVAFFRNIMGFIVIFSASLVAGSREYGVSASDDFASHYFGAFQLAGAGLSDGLFYYGNEFLISLYFKILYFIFGNLSAQKVMFFVSLLCSGLFFLWINKFILPKVPTKDKAFCLAICLLFFNYAMATQIMRQMLSSAILLYAISYCIDGRKKKALLFTGLATIAHITAVPIMLFFAAIIKYKDKGGLAISFLGGSLAYLVKTSASKLFIVLTPLLLALSATNKLQYYDENTNNDIFTTLLSSKTALVMFVLCLIPVKYWAKGFSAWKPLYVYGIVIYFIFAMLPNASRIMLIIPAFLFGPLCYFCFSKYKMSRFFLIIGMVAMMFFPHGISQKNTGFELWGSYNWYGDNPFYYL